MALQKEQIHAITGAVWLFGLAAMFYTGRWWPGILFVVGASMIVEGLLNGQSWYTLQGAAWVIGIGVWAMLASQVWFLFLPLGVAVLLGAIVPPPVFAKQPRP